MKAKDTILKSSIVGGRVYYPSLEDQAEESFKSGQDSRQDEIDLLWSIINDKHSAIIDLKSLLEMWRSRGVSIAKAYKAGIKEVVDWINNNEEQWEYEGKTIMGVPPDKWEAKCKEWGI